MDEMTTVGNKNCWSMAAKLCDETGNYNKWSRMTDATGNEWTNIWPIRLINDDDNDI
jgi:hypothetical protein